MVKLPGKVEPDRRPGSSSPASTTSPSSRFPTSASTSVREARAPLVTPPTCGEYATGRVHPLGRAATR